MYRIPWAIVMFFQKTHRLRQGLPIFLLFILLNLTACIQAEQGFVEAFDEDNNVDIAAAHSGNLDGSGSQESPEIPEMTPPTGIYSEATGELESSESESSEPESSEPESSEPESSEPESSEPESSEPELGDIHMFGVGMSTAGATDLPIDPNDSKGVYSSDRIAHRFVAKSSVLMGVKLYHIYTSDDRGYSAGDGGTISYSVYEDDETIDSRPTGQIIAKTKDIIAAPGLFANKEAAIKTYPNAVWSQYAETGNKLNLFRRIDFEYPAMLTPGKLYHIVVDNTSSNLSSHIGINNLRGGYEKQREHFYWDKANNFPYPRKNMGVSRYKNGEWTDAPVEQWAVYEHYYQDGTIDGQPYIANQNNDDGDGDRLYAIQGSIKARQLWVPERRVGLSEIGFYLARQFGSSNVELQVEQGGTTLFTGSIPSSNFPLIPGGPSTDMFKLLEGGQWGGIELPDVILEANEPAYIEISTSSDTQYEVFAVQDGVSSGYFSGGSHSLGFSVGHAQRSLDNGLNWTDFQNSGSIGPFNDLSFYAYGREY